MAGATLTVTRPAAPSPAAAILLLYFLSGAAGLSYEVLWARMLTAQFGLSIFGVAATVAAFLLGLGAGTLLARRRLRGSGKGAERAAWTPAQALAGYALVELAVALYALALPSINGLLSPVLDAAAAQMGWTPWCVLQGLLAVVLLGMPAAAIGASFPLVMHTLPVSPAVSGRVYAVNTAGAAAGALASLVLLAALGWSDALRAVALAGTAVAVLAFALARRMRGSAGETDVASAADEAAGIAPGMLLAYGAAGAAAILLEIGWTRLYGMVLLRTEYVLALILAVYLLGTAAGSALSARTQRSLVLAIPLVAGLGTLAGLWLLAPLSRFLQGQEFDSLGGALGVQALVLAACTLPVTAALGAWLPALARRAPGGRPGIDAAAGLYGANCLGGALGAILAVAVVIPGLGSAGCIALAAVLMIALGITLAPGRTAVPPPASAGRERRVLLAVLPLALAAAAMLRTLPPPARLGVPGTEGSTVLFTFEDALTLNHVIAGADGQRTLLTDLQRMDASSDPAAVALQADQARLPLLLHPAPRSVLLLGLGTGITAGGSLPWPGLERTAVEISPGAVRAASDAFAAVNGGVIKQVRVVQDDARHFLAATSGRYDVIVGDLFHPDLAGMSNLLSVEQFRRARARLADGGVFAQWIALNQFDRESLHTVLRSFRAVFPDAQLFLDGAHLAMVGSPRPLSAAAALRTAPGGDAATGGEGAATWLGRYWGPIAAGIGPVQSETRPVIEFRLPHLRYAGEDGQAASPLADILLELLRQRPDAARAGAVLGVTATEQPAFASAYAASELAVQAWLAEIANQPQRARALVRLAYEANPQDRWIASDLADDLLEAARADGTLSQPGVLERILRIRADHPGALRALWQRQRAAGRPDAPAALARLRAAAPLDHDAAAIGVRLP